MLIKVLVVDDHFAVRMGIKHLFEYERIGHTTTDSSQRRFVEPIRRDFTYCVGQAGNGTEALEMLSQETWDVVILDANMPDMSGLDVLARIKASHESSRVLMMSSLSENYAIPALKAGAQGFISKGTTPEEFMQAFYTVLSGRRYVSAQVAQLLADSLTRPSDTSQHEVLSEREFQVLVKLAKGVSINDIAEKLNLSNKTVSTYRVRIMEKMRFETNADIVAYAIRNQLLEG